MALLTQIRIVLTNTSHPGNIGAAARAMKTMGLGQLYLVQPKSFPDARANAMASNADDVLESAVVTASLEEAIGDCQLVLATSARKRHLNWQLTTPRTYFSQINTEIAKDTNIAIVFGNERTGLTNEQLQLCHCHLHIPSNDQYSSLNLAQAVQLIAYEARLAFTEPDLPMASNCEQLATAAEAEGLYRHLEQALDKLAVLDRAHPNKLMTRLRRLLQRSQLSQQEVNILRGICKAILKYCNK